MALRGLASFDSGAGGKYVGGPDSSVAVEPLIRNSLLPKGSSVAPSAMAAMAAIALGDSNRRRGDTGTYVSVSSGCCSGERGVAGTGNAAEGEGGASSSVLGVTTAADWRACSSIAE